MDARRILNRDILAALLIMAVALGVVENAQAGGPKGEKLEISDTPPGGPTVVTNMNPLAPKESSFKQVKEDLMRPFSSLDPKNSIEMENFTGVPLAQPQRPGQVPLSKHALEALDKKRNWAFTSYEELFLTPKPEEMFGIKQYGADALEKKGGSAVDKYYQNLDQKNGITAKQAVGDMNTARAEFINRNGFDPLGASFQSSDPFLKGMFGSASSENATEKSGATEGLVATMIATPRELKMEQKRLDDMRRKIWGDAGIRVPRPGENSTGSLVTDDYYSQNPKTSANGLSNPLLSDAAGLKQKSANPFIVADPTANVLHSHINDDLTARALGLPQPLASQYTNASRPGPTAQSVQAEWDPFGANRMKPKF